MGGMMLLADEYMTDQWAEGLGQGRSEQK